MLDIRDLCKAYLEGYIHAKAMEFLLSGKALSSDLDKVKDIAVECMNEYVSQQNLSEEEKEKVKENHKQWADATLEGIKQRLRDSGKIEG